MFINSEKKTWLSVNLLTDDCAASLICLSPIVKRGSPIFCQDQIFVVNINSAFFVKWLKNVRTKGNVWIISFPKFRRKSYASQNC